MRAPTLLRALLVWSALALPPACGGAGDAVISPDGRDGPPGADTLAPADAHVDAAATDAAGDVSADTWAPPPPTVWPAGDRPALLGPFHERHPELAPWSRWRTHLDGSPEPSPSFRARGAFGLGNGHVFALVGMADPANTIHGLAGPTYEQGENFYGDVALGVTGPDGASWNAFDEQWVLASFGAPALLWRGVRGGLELETIDLVPWDAAEALPDALRQSWLRTILVRNRGAAPLAGLTLEVRAVGAAAAADGASLTQTRPGRRLVVFFAAGPDGTAPAAAAEGRQLALPLPDIAPGAEIEVVLALLTLPEGGDEAAARAEVVAAVGGGGGVDALLETSAAALQAWWGGLLRLETPDPMVDDLVRALALSLKYQLTASGATSPMSHYAGTWTRDNIGPLRALLALGGFDDAAGVLDYYYRAVLVNGGLANRYPCDLPLTDPLPPAPDWAALPPGSGRTAAEAPSYIPIQYGDYVAWTGDLARARERFGFLAYTLDTQFVSPEGLLVWSGDETFRAAMGAALGIDLEYPLPERTWSPNSSLLYAAGARRLAELHALAGDDAAAVDWRAAADHVERAALAHLRLPDGCWAAWRYREEWGGELSPGPFEDVALKEIWAGARDGADPDAQARLQCLVDRVGQAPGILQSPLHERYTNLFPFARLGVYTGMLPGYTLFALARAGHPEAEAAFDALRLSADTGGFSTEYMVYDDHLPLQLLYVPEGTGAVDYTARFRPWEGGIVLHALLDYVVGVQPRLDGSLVLRPHLPNGWPAFTARGVRVHDALLDVAVTRTAPDAAEIAVANRGERALSVSIVWDPVAASVEAVVPAGQTYRVRIGVGD